MVIAEISITPIGTGQSSVSFYVARALESVSDMPGLHTQLNAMGTILESDSMETIWKATDMMLRTVHNLGVARVGVILKIDSRRDKSATAAQKVEAIRRHTNT